MAKQDTVYSLFGMETPQEVARKQFEQAFSYTPGPSGYQRAGAGLGKLFTALAMGAAGDSQAVREAKEKQAILQSAQMDYQREKRMREEEAKAAQQAEIDARLGGIEGALATEAGPGTLPEVTVAEPSREEQMMLRFEDNANMYDMMAERLASMGYVSEADSARNAATDQRLKGFALQKTLAEIRAEEAKAGMAKAPTTRTRIEGDEKIVEEWDGTKWNTVSSGPRYKPGTEVNINQGSGAFDKQLGEDMSSQLTDARKAVANASKSLENLNTMEGLLDSGIITGTFAKSRTAVEKALASAGLIDGTRVTNTETFLAAGAQQTLALLQTGAAGAGTGISDADRDFMENAAGGKISVTEDAIRRIIRINRQIAQNVYGTYNQIVGDIQTTFPDSESAKRLTPRYYPGQRANYKGEIITYNPRLGWVDSTGKPVSVQK